MHASQLNTDQYHVDQYITDICLVTLRSLRRRSDIAKGDPEILPRKVDLHQCGSPSSVSPGRSREVCVRPLKLWDVSPKPKQRAARDVDPGQSSYSQVQALFASCPRFSVVASRRHTGLTEPEVFFLLTQTPNPTIPRITFSAPKNRRRKAGTRRCETSPHSWVTMVLLGTRSNRGSAMPPVSTRTTVRGGDRHTSARCSYAARIARQSGPASKRNPPCSPWVFRVSEDTHNLSQWFTFLIAGP